jgi:transcriptional regulator with XRE-family HTH domain
MAKSREAFLKKVAPQVRKAGQARGKEIVLGQVLRSFRQGQHIPQAVVAEAMGVTQPAIARLEKQKDVKLSTLQALAESMGGELVVGIRHKGKVFDLIGAK